MALVSPATAPPAPRLRRDTVLTGTVLAAAAGVTLIGGLLAVYFQTRQAVVAGGDPWGIPSAKMPNGPLAVTYGALLLSAFTAQWAYAAIKVGERQQTYVAVGVTMLLGAAFVNGLSYCYTQLAQVAGESPYANVVYAVSGTHLVFVIAALALFVAMGFRVLGGQFGGRNVAFVTSAVIVWHAVVATGIVVWWCLWFLTGGPG